MGFHLLHNICLFFLLSTASTSIRVQGGENAKWKLGELLEVGCRGFKVGVISQRPKLSARGDHHHGGPTGGLRHLQGGLRGSSAARVVPSRFFGVIIFFGLAPRVSGLYFDLGKTLSVVKCGK